MSVTHGTISHMKAGQEGVVPAKLEEHPGCRSHRKIAMNEQKNVCLKASERTQLAQLPQALPLPPANIWPVNEFSHRCWPPLPSQDRQLAESQNLRSPERREGLSWPCHRQSWNRLGDLVGCFQTLVTGAGMPSLLGGQHGTGVMFLNHQPRSYPYHRSAN